MSLCEIKWDSIKILLTVPDIYFIAQAASFVITHMAGRRLESWASMEADCSTKKEHFHKLPDMKIQKNDLQKI